MFFILYNPNQFTINLIFKKNNYTTLIKLKNKQNINSEACLYLKALTNEIII